MQNSGSQLPGSDENSASRYRWPWLLAIPCVLIILVAILLPRPNANSPATPPLTNGRWSATGPNSPGERSGRVPHVHSPGGPAPTAEEIVADKVSQFGSSRREIARAIGRRIKKEVPSEVKKFFDAVESGRWEEIDAQFKVLATHSGQYEYSTNHWPELNPFWPAVLDAYGPAEAAHLWPAQNLLDYGNAALDSLRPGMIYVGGTDPGRFIPTLLNETSDGERHIILTQNALADGRYLDYLKELYGDRMATLSSEDSQRGFQDYLADAQKRFQHDQQFPDEPKQIRPGEDIKINEGRVQVSGQVAVMAINEILLQTLMQKNPDLSFAVQESLPMKGTYADAAPLGPLMELRAQDGPNAFTADRAAQTLDYWRTATQQVLSDPVASGSTEALKSYAHDAQAAANLLAAHGFNTEAEQAYRLALEIYPANADIASRLAKLFANTGRADEGRQLVEDFGRRYPNERTSDEEFRGSILFTTRPDAKKEGGQPP